MLARWMHSPRARCWPGPRGSPPSTCRRCCAPRTASRSARRRARHSPGSELPAAARACLHAPDADALAADLTAGSSGAQILLCTDAGVPATARADRGCARRRCTCSAVAALSSPQLAMVGSRSPTPPDARPRANLPPGSRAPGSRHQRSRAGHRCREPRRAHCTAAGDDGGARQRPRPHLSAGARGARGAHRAHGALVSEFPPGTPPLKRQLPAAQPLISGLCARHAGGGGRRVTAAR